VSPIDNILYFGFNNIYIVSSKNNLLILLIQQKMDEYVMKKHIYLFIAVLFLACGENKDDKSETSVSQRPVESVKNVQVTWQVPAGWIEETPGRMRKAQFSIPKEAGDSENAEAVVFYFSGQGGDVQSNIERWYGFFKQPDGRPTKDVATVKKVKVNELAQTILDVAGTYLFKPRPMAPTSVEKPGFRMLAAVVETAAGPYFVRFVGPQKTIDKWQNSFYQFLGSFKEQT
jgi:hypothetical protein